jgi:hypothetical protein
MSRVSLLIYDNENDLPYHIRCKLRSKLSWDMAYLSPLNIIDAYCIGIILYGVSHQRIRSHDCRMGTISRDW